MYYLWKHATSNRTAFFSCGMEQFDGWTDIPWNMGHKIEADLPSIIRYYSCNFMQPEDYPMTGTTFHFLISDRITDILKKFEFGGIDYYKSQIIYSNGYILNNYHTINILNTLDCINNNLSVYEIRKYGSAEIYKYKKTWLDYSKIPEGIKLFHIKYNGGVPVIHESIKQALEEVAVSGITFEPLSGG